MPQDPMPALQPGVKLHDRVLRINGTTGDDRITVEADAKDPSLLDVNLNGTVTQFDGAGVIRLDIYGGPGNDVVELRDAARQGIAVDFHGHGGDDQLLLSGQYGAVNADGGAGDDVLQGVAGTTNLLRGGAGNDTLVGGDWSDTLYGGDGNDSLAGGNAILGPGNLLHGDAGNDTIVGGRGLDGVDGGAGDDSITTAGGDDGVTAGDGNDLVDTGAGDDRVWGGAGDDVIRAGEGDDLVYGEAGDDTLWGQSGDDTLTGDAGFTTELMAQPTPAPGDDSLDGGAGNDYLVGSRESLTFADDNGKDTLTGGPGGDVINARGNDVATDAAADDVMPARDTAGAGPFAVQQTATLYLLLPPTAAGGAGYPIALPDGLGKFAGSTFYADADGTLHMQDTVARQFTLGEFFRNWGVPVSLGRKAGRFGAFANAEIKVNGVVNPAVDRWVVHAGDVITVVISV
jgi:Ca2+-binding RTX toxin-like protein